MSSKQKRAYSLPDKDVRCTEFTITGERCKIKATRGSKCAFHAISNKIPAPYKQGNGGIYQYKVNN